MKLYVPTHGRADRITTPALFADSPFDVHVLFHTADERDRYLDAGRLPDNVTLHVTGAENKVVGQNNWAKDHLIDPGDWYVKADDNIRRFTGVRPDLYDHRHLPVQEDKRLRDAYAHEYSPTDVYEALVDMAERGDRLNSFYQGMSLTDNYYFRGKKYRPVAWVIAKIFLSKHTGTYHDERVVYHEGHDFTGAHLLRYGRVTVNNFLRPHSGHYKSGGLGTYADRLPQKLYDCAYLIKKYDGLYRYTDKKGCHPKGELALRFYTLDAVEQWRQSLAA